MEEYPDMEEVDAYITRALRVDRIVRSTDDAEVDGCLDQVAEWVRATANALVETGLEPEEVVCAVGGLVTGILALWFTEKDNDDS